ncbi:MAG: DNA replication and repair protein RecF [Porticoccus sp.]|jgi:DNA replication and repair protein RecF
MTYLNRLKVTDVRNIRSATLLQFSQTNLIYGANGSGKTSLLECINMLGLGRSFRGLQMKPVINNEAEHCTVFGELSTASGGTSPVGVAKSRKGETKLKLDGELITSVAPLAELLPLQLISTDTHLLLSGSPKIRRQYIDWGLFHVEHEFLFYWRRLQQALKQRNSLLRRGRISSIDMDPWEQQLSAASDIIHGFRSSYIAALNIVFKDTLAALYDEHEEIELHYSCGWDTDKQYSQYLIDNREKDAQRGFTQAGAHRADLKVKVGKLAAADVLSRGQQKLLVAALRLSQGKLLQQQTGRKAIYLVDDLPAELDKRHRQRFVSALFETGSQVFITCVEAEDLVEAYTDKEQPAMFHVEHGKVVQQ